MKNIIRTILTLLIVVSTTFTLAAQSRDSTEKKEMIRQQTVAKRKAVSIQHVSKKRVVRGRANRAQMQVRQGAVHEAQARRADSVRRKVKREQKVVH